MPHSSDQPDRLRLERRAEERSPLSGSVMGAFVDDEGAFTLTRVELIDESAAGLGLLSPVEIQPGRRFTLYVGPLHVAHDSGVVARCEMEDEGYRVGLRCDGRMAA
jgi:predicted N-acetyltransferase YhbS